MIQFLNHIDTQIYLFFNGMHSPFFDELMMICTGRFVWIPLYLALLLIIVRSFKPRSALIYIVAVALTIVLADQVCSGLLRPMFQRLRPSNEDNTLSAMAHIVNGYRGGRYGFPSCHGANSFALATFMACLIRRWRLSIFVFVWASFNAYTRLYLGVHYPGDLVVGAIIGAAIAVGMHRAAVRFDTQHPTVAHARYRTPLFNIGAGGMSIGITIGDLTIATGLLTLIVAASLT